MGVISQQCISIPNSTNKYCDCNVCFIHFSTIVYIHNIRKYQWFTEWCEAVISYVLIVNRFRI